MGNDRRTQMDECYRRLRRLLLHGQIPSGQRITETHWAGRLGVHRGSLREAMGILAHEGLLERGEGGGFFVPRLGADTVREIIETRMAIESGAIRLALMRECGIDTSPLREICGSMEQIIGQGFDLGFAEADRSFHENLVRLAGNARLERVYVNAPLGIYPSNIADEHERINAYRKTLDEHRTLCGLIDGGQADKACEFLRQHLLASIASFTLHITQ